MAEEKRLIGEDAKLMRGTLGTVSAVAAPIAADTWVQIVTKGTFASWTDLEVGDLWYNNTGSAATPTGATYQVLALEDMLDLSGWALEVTADKIETTVIADGFKKYRNGKKDASGSADFVFIKGITDVAASGIMDSFFKIVDIADTGVATVTPVNTTPYYILGYLDYTDTVVGNHKLATLMQVEFEGFPLNFKMGEASNVSVNFHLVGSIDPIIYRVENAA
jgi:hypothetical protein